MDNEKPFRCIQCNLCFATSDHLIVHQRIHTTTQNNNANFTDIIPHENSNNNNNNNNTNNINSNNNINNNSTINNNNSNNSHNNNDHEKANVDHLLVKMANVPQTEHCTDQTPTPTRFVKCSDVDGSVLFEDINPFEQDFKMASAKRPLPSTETELCASQENMQSPYKRSEVAYKLAKILPLNPENQNGVNTLEVEGTPNPACAVQMAKYKAEAKQRLVNAQNAANPGNNEQSDVVMGDCDMSTSNTQVFVSSNCRENATSSCSSTMVGPNMTQTPTQPGSAISNSENEDSAETSLQSLLQQLQKESVDVNKSDPGSAGQSQDALREQLKSLIKSGQIKIKFTSDPSSPKVQATIVGNITKKTAVKTTLPTMVSDVNTTRPTMVQSMLSTARPTMVPEMLPKGEEASSPPSKKIPIREKELAKVTSPTTPQLVPRFLSSKVPIPSTIQILPKPLFKPIAPKTTTDTPTCGAAIASQRPVLPATDIMSGGSPNLTVLHSNNNLVFAKQKLKQSLQQNIAPLKPPDMSMMNGHVSMVAGSGGVQKKYKNIVLDMYHTPNSNAGVSNATSAQFHGVDNKRKQFEEDDDDPKRKKFLERNRAAASRCRQKRKIWVNQLETKSDNLLKTNSLLLNEINALRSEVVQLKSLLLAHKDCPVTKQQKALLGQMTPGSYIAAVSDGQIIAIHQIPDGGTGTSSTTTTTSNITPNFTSTITSDNFNITSSQETKLAEELASSALTDMAARATQELGSGTSGSSVTVQSNITISSGC